MKEKFLLSVLSLFLFCSYLNADVKQDISLKSTSDLTKVVLFPFKKSVVSSIVDAPLKKYNFKEGEIFKEGEVIAELEDDLYQNLYNISKAEHDQALSNYNFTENTFEQNERLFNKGGLSVQEFEKFKLDRNNAKAELEKSESALKIAKMKLDACCIKAPFNGRLTEQLVNEHEFIRAGQPILEVINDSKLLAIMHLPSSEINNVKVGMTEYFLIDENGKKYKGEIYEVSGYIYSSSRTFEAKAVIDNANRELYAGMSGTLLK